MAVGGLQHPVAEGGGGTPLPCAYPVAGTQLSHPQGSVTTVERASEARFHVSGQIMIHRHEE